MNKTVLAMMTLVALNAAAEAPRFFNLEGFGEFLDGNPETTAITEDGAIALPPVVRERYSDAAASFSAATAWGEDVVVARAADGEVLAIDRAGKARTIYKAEEKLVTALLATERGLFVAVGAPAKLVLVTERGKAAVFHTPDAAYIWGMLELPDGNLLCVTGEPGTVLKVDAKGNGHVLFSPDQEHLRAITRDKDLGVFVGGGSRGIVYRSTDLKAFRALYDTGHPEVTALVATGQHVYAAGVTGAEALASEAPAPEKRSKGKSSTPEVRSQLVQIGMDGSGEVLAGSSDEAVFALAIDDHGRVLVATGATGREDPRGRLYTVEPEGRLISMIYQSPSKRLTHLVTLPRQAIAAVGAEGGRIIHLAGGIAPEGQFFTVPYDTGINSRFGVIQIFGAWPKGSKVSAAVRSGQTAELDTSWSEWSKEIAAPGGSRVTAPNGRYAQVRLTLASKGDASPLVQRVRLAYLRQNLPPFVREVVTLKKGLALLPLPAEEPKSKTVSLNDKASEDSQRDSDDRHRPPQARQVEQRGALTVRWLAEDPNGDDLRYELSFRPLGNRDWQKMDDKLDQPFFTMNSAQLPDGHYQFRVRATDAPSNPDGTELSDSRESRSILVDNTAPRVESPEVQVSGRKVTVRAKAGDTVGPIMRAEYALDAQAFRPLMPDDGVLDGAAETFTLTLADVEAGAHVVTIRVADEAENEGFGEAQFVTR